MKRSGPTVLLSAMVMLLISFTSSEAQETRVSVPLRLSISEAIQLAVAHNPAVTEASALVSASSEKLTQAKSGFYPQVYASADYSRTTSPLWAFGTTLNQGLIGMEDFDPDRLNDPEAVSNYGLSLSAVWSLYDSGQTWYGVRQAKMGRTSAGLVMNRATQEVISGTLSAYNGVLLSREHLETILLALKTAEASEAMIRSRFESGFVVKSDLLQTQVHIAHLTQQRLHAESHAAVARAALCAAMGVNADTPFELEGKLVSTMEATGSLEKWLETAMATRPDLKAMNEQENIAEAEIRKAKSSRLPSIALSAEYGTNSDTFGDGKDIYTVGAVVNMNLFSGFRVSGQIAEASQNLKQIRARKSGLELKISMETRSAYYQTQSTWQQIRVAETAVTQAEEALRIVKDRYETDLVTIVELLNAELALQQARTNRLQAIHDYNNAKADLMLAAGILNVDFK
jgi:TolC family type I secretion outer membrane protein